MAEIGRRIVEKGRQTTDSTDNRQSKVMAEKWAAKNPCGGQVDGADRYLDQVNGAVRSEK
jgi:hypothetical protein